MAGLRQLAPGQRPPRLLWEVAAIGSRNELTIQKVKEILKLDYFTSNSDAWDRHNAVVPAASCWWTAEITESSVGEERVLGESASGSPSAETNTEDKVTQIYFFRSH